MREFDYINYIKEVTIPIESIDDNYISSFKWLSDEIYIGKALLKTNSVKFIIVKILNRQGKTKDIQRRDFFDVYVVGDFRKSFSPVLRVAEAFADFYLEIRVLPNIIPVPMKFLKENREILHKLKNGVLIYERR